MATTHPEYNEKTAATEVASAFADQIHGKIGQLYLTLSGNRWRINTDLIYIPVVITGVGPNSLGEALALAIGSQQPAKLFLASRTESKVQQVADKIRQLSPSTAVEVVTLKSCISKINPCRRIEDPIRSRSSGHTDQQRRHDGTEQGDYGGRN